MATGFRQEMPPEGGYAPFEFAKTVKSRLVKGKYMLAGWALASYGLYKAHLYFYRKNILDPEIENTEANIAIEPILMAERNRLFLRRLIDNRDYEKEVMKDVPGWVPGTYYGSPIFHQKHIWHDPAAEEFWAHSDYWKGYYNQQMERHKH